MLTSVWKVLLSATHTLYVPICLDGTTVSVGAVSMTTALTCPTAAPAWVGHAYIITSCHLIPHPRPSRFPFALLAHFHLSALYSSLLSFHGSFLIFLSLSFLFSPCCSLSLSSFSHLNLSTFIPLYLHSPSIFFLFHISLAIFFSLSYTFLSFVTHYLFFLTGTVVNHSISSSLHLFLD